MIVIRISELHFYKEPPMCEKVEFIIGQSKEFSLQQLIYKKLFMHPKPGQSNSFNPGLNMTEQEIKKKKLQICSQINRIKNMISSSKPGTFNPPNPPLKVHTITKLPTNLTKPDQNQLINPVHDQKQTPQEKYIPEPIQKPMTKNQEPLENTQKSQLIVDQIMEKNPQKQQLIERIDTLPKIPVDTPKTPEKDKTFKRPLDLIISSQEVKKQTQQIGQQRKMQSNIKSETQNESTCIQITSSSGDQDSAQEVITKSKNENIEDSLMEVTNKNHKKYESPADTSIQSLFSNFKLSYVFINDQILVKYKKERRRLENEGKEFKNFDSKVKPKVCYISLPKTIPIHFISERIIKKEWISDEFRFLRFWLFKGNTKDLEQTLIETAKHENSYIESKRLVNMKNLYEWYTLAHLLASSSNIVVVVEKLAKAVLIRNVQQMKCSYCRSNVNQTCLCSNHPVPKKPCCEQAVRIATRHEILCKFSSDYKAILIKGENDHNARRGLVGLANHQNSCFMNTALQCLASCEPLTEYFLGKEHLKNINYGNHLGTFGQIAVRYAEFLKEMHVTSKPCLQIQKFRKSLFRWDNKYSRDEQEDSQEFLIQLLDWLKEDLNLNNNRPEYVSEEEDESLSIENKAQIAWKRHLSRNNSIIEYLMAGVIRSCISCQECLYESNRFQTFLTLPLPMSQSLDQKKARNSFEVKVFLVYSNFRKKNQIAVIRLESFKYEDAMKQIKKTFALEDTSQLIGLFCNKQGSYRIKNAVQGSAVLKKSIQNPQFKLIFLEHRKSQLQGQTTEVCFTIKLKSKQAYLEVPLNFKRYLYFSRKQKPSASLLFKKLLLYFYNVMYKNLHQISVEAYLNKYFNQEAIPFKVYLVNPIMQITLDQPISWENKAQVFVSIENQVDFATKHLFLAFQLNKDKVDNQTFHEKTSKGTKISINDCFQQFARADVMEDGNSWNCPKCKQKRKAFKKMSIYKAPKILILFFKRFESQHYGLYHKMRKIQALVQFPHLLDLKDHVQNEEMPYTDQKCDLKFRLFAVANHINLTTGGGEMGHYFAFINHNNNWYRINDDKISPIGQGEVCTRNAYMLFYTREQAQ